MPSIKRAINYILHNQAQFCDSLIKNIGRYFPDKLYLSMRFRCQMGYWPNFKHPKTFQEKINWLKLYNRKAEYTLMVDKLAVKEYVAKLIGEKYIIPTIGVWNSLKEIEWDKLPKQFVLKTTHGGGSCAVIFCKDKNTFDKNEAIVKLSTGMKADIYTDLREWPYKNVFRRVIAEEFMEEKINNAASADLSDYKFYCFNGEPRMCQVIRDRNIKETIDFYNMDWVHMEVVGLNPNVENGQTPVEKPVHLQQMKDICRKLSDKIPFLRVDLYVINNQIYFGETTFFPASGLGSFRPYEWNEKLGNWIVLP